ncbi:hypothetical protein KA005_21535 [bacterium]|nr:hypothetical protein [bacterium]
MKINFNVGLKNLEGKILKADGKDVTLKDVSADALLGNYKDENIDGKEKLKRFMLATKIYEANGELELDVDDIKLTKDLIAKGYSVLVTARAWGILDPHKK